MKHMMLRVGAVVAMVAAVLAVSACQPSAPAQAIDEVTVSGAVFQQPDISFKKPLEITESASKQLVKGSGDPVKADEPVLVDYRSVWADSGSDLKDTYSSEPLFITPNDAKAAPWIADALAGASPGARILQVQPGTDADTAGLVTVFDVLPLRAEGAPQDPRPDMPTVTLADNGEPSVTIPTGTTAPAELSVATLIKGSGEQVEAGEYVTMQYKEVTWADGAVQESTWDTMAPKTVQVGVGNLLKGLDEGLIDQTVGSQVLMVIPPPEGDIQRGTLVYVIDVLSVRGEPTAQASPQPTLEVTPDAAPSPAG